VSCCLTKGFQTAVLDVSRVASAADGPEADKGGADRARKPNQNPGRERASGRRMRLSCTFRPILFRQDPLLGGCVRAMLARGSLGGRRLVVSRTGPRFRVRSDNAAARLLVPRVRVRFARLRHASGVSQLWGCSSRPFCRPKEHPMHTLLTRHTVEVLLAAGHTHQEVARHAGVCERTVYRIAKEQPVTHVDDKDERQRRRVGRPGKAEPYRAHILELLEQDAQLMSLEVLRRCRQRGYDGGKTAIYDLIAQIRPASTDFVMRFEGLPGEFSQHDFGQVNVKFLNRTRKKIRFFASRLKWSRWAEVTVVANEQAETLVRTLLDHCVQWGGVPLCCVFDRPKTVALEWSKDGTVTEWNPTFAFAAMEIGFTAEVCWPNSPRQKGTVENIVKWVKNSFFKQRRFLDMDDLLQQLGEWLQEVNCQRPSRATDVIPAERLGQEQQRLRPAKVQPDQLALRVAVSVGVTGYVVHDTHPYSMPPEAAGLPGTLYLYRDRVRIIAGRHQVEHPRLNGRKEQSTLPEHRSAQLAAVSGKRGKRYLARQHLFDTGEAAVEFLTELVHANPRGWIRDVELLHDLLQRHGSDAMNRAFRAAVDVRRFDAHYVGQLLNCAQHESIPLFPSEVPK